MAKIEDKPEPIESPKAMTLEELRQLGGRVVGDIVEPIDEWDMMIEPTRAKTLEEMRAEGVKILGDIMEPLDEWDMTK